MVMTSATVIMMTSAPAAAAPATTTTTAARERATKKVAGMVARRGKIKHHLTTARATATAAAEAAASANTTRIAETAWIRILKTASRRNASTTRRLVELVWPLLSITFVLCQRRNPIIIEGSNTQDKHLLLEREIPIVFDGNEQNS